MDRADDRLLRVTGVVFLVALLVHAADHLRRGFDVLTTTVFWAGNFQLVAAVVALVLVFRGHRLAPPRPRSRSGSPAPSASPPPTCSRTGARSATRSPAPRSHPASLPSRGSPRLFEIGADLAFGWAGLRMLRARGFLLTEPRRCKSVGMIAWEASGAGPPIVFVHGITEDRHAWHSVVPFLEDSFRCVRLDLRGHGASSDADDYSPLAMAGDVATVIAEADINEPPILVGHSLGGFVVTAYAAKAARTRCRQRRPVASLGGFATALQSLASQLRGPAFRQTLQRGRSQPLVLRRASTTTMPCVGRPPSTAPPARTSSSASGRRCWTHTPDELHGHGRVRAPCGGRARTSRCTAEPDATGYAAWLANHRCRAPRSRCGTATATTRTWSNRSVSPPGYEPSSQA